MGHAHPGAEFLKKASPPSSLPLLYPNAEWTKGDADFVLTLAPTWEEFKGKLSRNIKESLRKCYNSLKRDGHEFRVEVTTARSEVAAVLDRFFFLHQARAELSAPVNHRNAFDASMARRFLGDVCERFADRGALRIFRLENRRQGVAAMRARFRAGRFAVSLLLGLRSRIRQVQRHDDGGRRRPSSVAIEQRLPPSTSRPGTTFPKTRWSPAEIVFRQASIVSPSRRGELTHEVYRRARKAVADSAPLRSVAARFLARRSE